MFSLLEELVSTRIYSRALLYSIKVAIIVITEFLRRYFSDACCGQQENGGGRAAAGRGTVVASS